MNIIVVGCGKIGSTLVESLSAEGHDVVALEKDAPRSGTDHQYV